MASRWTVFAMGAVQYVIARLELGTSGKPNLGTLSPIGALSNELFLDWRYGTSSSK